MDGCVKEKKQKPNKLGLLMTLFIKPMLGKWKRSLESFGKLILYHLLNIFHGGLYIIGWHKRTL